MGEVFRAYDQRLGRRVALKQIRPGDAGSAATLESRRARLRREAWAAAQISHPNLVQIYDILDDPEGADGGGEWIVMEFVSGRTLAELVSNGPVSLSHAVGLGRQVAEGLAAAHARGVIHRDLKTENVMVATDGQAKVLDFGLAKPVGAGDPATWTGAGAIVGTVRAMSPEQARGRQVDFRTDLFSLGTLIYELVTGTSPFLDQGTASTLTRVCSHQPPLLGELRGGVPKELSRLVDHLLQKIPEARPESAAVVAAMLAEIEEALDPQESGASSSGSQILAVADMETLFPGDDPGEPIPPPSDVWESETSLSRFVRSRPFVTLGGVLVAALGVVLVATLARPEPGPSSAPAAPGGGSMGGAVQPVSAYDHLKRGRTLLARHDREGNVDAAVEAFQSALDLRADYAPAYAGLARARWRQYRSTRDPAVLEQAHENAQRAVELDPELSASRLALAQTTLGLGRLDEAMAEVRDVLQLDPANAKAHRLLGEALDQSGDAAGARSAYEKAHLLDPASWEIAFELAAVEQRLGHLDRAEDLLEQASVLAPENAVVYFSLGAVAHYRGDYAVAARRFQRSVEIRPTPAAYSNLGTLYFFQQLYDESIDAYERAVQLDSEGHIVWGNLGDAYRWGGRMDDARAAYSQAVDQLEAELQSFPDDPRRRSRMALLLAKRGDHEEARSQLKAIDTDDDAQVLYRIALAFELSDQRDAALEALASALAAGYPMAEIRLDPELAGLREDPAASRLLQSHRN